MCTLKVHAVRSRLTYFAHGLLLHIVQQVRWYASEKSIKVLTFLTLLGLKLGFSLLSEYLTCRYLEVTGSVCVCHVWHQTCVCDEYYLPLLLYLSSSLASFICWTMPCLGALSLYSLSAPPFISKGSGGFDHLIVCAVWRRPPLSWNLAYICSLCLIEQSIALIHRVLWTQLCSIFYWT